MAVNAFDNNWLLLGVVVFSKGVHNCNSALFFVRFLEEMKASQFAFEFFNLYFWNIEILYLVTIEVIKLNYLPV